MTLLELLRQELPKRGGWPEGATEAEVFTYEKGLINFWTSEGKSLSNGIFNFKSNSLDLDEVETVTREQYEATGWDGRGLPPVDYKCEVSVDGGRSWCTYKAINEKNGARLIEIGNFTEEFQNNNWIFRPLRTEAERAIDEMVQLSGVSTGAAKILYDAGYRK